MRYVICHGELANQPAFDSGRTRIGFYVQQLGQVLLKQETITVLARSLKPTLWLTPRSSREFNLTPVRPDELFAMRQALGARADDPDIVFLDRATTLSGLVRQYGQDELRMITCTAAEGAPRVASQEELLPGIVVDFSPPAESRNNESVRIDHQVGQLLLKRQKSAAQAGAYITELGAEAAEFWVSSTVTTALMVEWQVQRQQPVTADVSSWLNTLYWVLAPLPSAASLYAGQHAGIYPGYGDDLRARLTAINGFAADWPACLRQYGMAWAGGADQRMVMARDYLTRPAGSPSVAANTQRFLRDYLPLRVGAEAFAENDLASWHAYLEALQSLSTADRVGLDALVNTDAYPPVMANWAVAQQGGFGAFWSKVTSEYPGTVAPLLREAARSNAQLRQLIEAADQGLQTARRPVQADAMDFGPSPSLAAPRRPLDANAPRLHCVSCNRVGPHNPLAAPQFASQHQGVRVCRGCGQLVGEDSFAAFGCQECGNVSFLHQRCL